MKMAPNERASNLSIIEEKNVENQEAIFEASILWERVAFFAVVNLLAFYAFCKVLTDWDYFTAFLLIWFVHGMPGLLGVTMGAHRYFAHRSFKATFPVKIFLLLAHAATGQNSMYVWVRDHRVHHKFSDTDADPHNSQRGFFFSHMGWLMMSKHPDVKRKGRTVDMSDLTSDYWVMFQYKYVFHLFCILNFLITYSFRLLGYSWEISILVGLVLRYVLTLHFTWFVNSWAHFFGNKPYNAEIRPVENKIVSYLTGGEGWHNYHHTFPWDYKAGEFGDRWNITCQVIELCSKLGLVYDLKSPKPELVRDVLMKKGDGSHEEVQHNHKINY